MSRGIHNVALRFTVLATLAALAVALLCAAPVSAEPAHANPRARCAHTGSAPQQATLHYLRTSMLCLVNRVRERYGIAPLRFNIDLFRSATGHSNDMVRNGYFSHYGSAGSTLTGRVGRAGYLAGAGFYLIGENIGGGPGRRFGSPIQVFRSWMDSPPHRANMLDPKFYDFGVGVARGYPYGGGMTAATYTLDLGTRR
jgi:uncharacterized protein YkwD